MSGAVYEPERVPARPAQDRGNPRAVLLWFLALPFLASLVFVLFFLLGARGGKAAVLAMAALTGVVCFIPVILDQGRAASHRHLMLSLFGLGYLVYMVAPPFTLYAFEDIVEEPGSVSILHVLPGDVLWGQVAALAALVSFLAAYGLPAGRRLGRALPAPRREWSEAATVTVSLGLIGLGWVFFLGNQFGFIPGWLGSGVLGAISGSTIFGLALLAIAYLKDGSRAAFLLLLVIIPPTMFFNFFTGSKTLFLAPLMMVAYAYVVVRRRIRARWLIPGILLIALYYPVAQFHREVILRGNTLGAGDVIGDAGEILSATASYAQSFRFVDYLGDGIRMTSGRLEGLGVLSVIVRDTPDKVPYQGGWTLSYIFLSYVPRLLWPNKPPMTIGHWVTAMYGPGPIPSNTGPTWMGELYFNFGFPGLVLGMALLGIWFRVLHEMFFRPNATIPALLVGAVVIFCTVPSLQGGVLGPINGVTYLATPILLTHFAICMLTRPPRQPRAFPPPDLARGGARGGV